VTGLREGDRVGRWQLRRCLGEGEFGATWLARDASGHQAAVKLLAEPPGDELRALARVVHPVVVQVLGGGGTPVPHLVMEFARGRPLTAWLRKPAPPSTATRITAFLADALATMHQADVVHGDIKPDNVMVESIRPTRLKIVDFGLANQRHGGTLNYAAPERTRGGFASPASDVYSLGLILWQMLHGSLPWAEQGGMSAPLMMRGRAAPRAEVGEPWLADLLTEVLSPTPENRPAAAQFADRLASHGVNLPAPDTQLLARRARSLWVAPPPLRKILERWFEQGGNLALVGPDGCGRSQALDHVAHELSARGQAWLRLDTGASSWVSIEHALASPGLPGGAVRLPDVPDPETRASTAARLLFGRCPVGFALLADDLHRAGDPTRRFIEALTTIDGVSLCVAGRDAPTWVDDVHAITPFDAAEGQALVRGLLGDLGDASPLYDRLAEVSAGLPGAAVAFLLHAVAEGGLVWRARQWHIDPIRLGHVQAAPVSKLALDTGLGDDAARLACLVAASPSATAMVTLKALTGMGGEQGHRGTGRHRAGAHGAAEPGVHQPGRRWRAGYPGRGSRPHPPPAGLPPAGCARRVRAGAGLARGAFGGPAPGRGRGTPPAAGSPRDRRGRGRAPGQRAVGHGTELGHGRGAHALPRGRGRSGRGARVRRVPRRRATAQAHGRTSAGADGAHPRRIARGHGSCPAAAGAGP